MSVVNVSMMSRQSTQVTALLTQCQLRVVKDKIGHVDNSSLCIFNALPSILCRADLFTVHRQTCTAFHPLWSTRRSVLLTALSRHSHMNITTSKQRIILFRTFRCDTRRLHPITCWERRMQTSMDITCDIGRHDKQQLGMIDHKHHQLTALVLCQQLAT